MQIVDSDAFLDMPLSAQSLYFHLNMRADDDGFVNNPKKIQRMIGASDDDLKLLILKRFLLVFDSGVIVIKHWRMHNLLRSNRYKPTQYQDEFSRLQIKENGAYTDNGQPVASQVAAIVQPDDSQRLPQDRIGKDSKVKDRKGEDKKKPPTLEEVKAYCKERNSPVDPEQFWQYFEAGGWKDAKGQPVRSWKQKLLTWEKYETPTRKKTGNAVTASGSYNDWDVPGMLKNIEGIR